jgi:hypothetical protein
MGMTKLMAPQLNRSIVCIADRKNIELAGAISSIFSASDLYFCIFLFQEINISAGDKRDTFGDGFLTRIIAEEHSIVINNALARLRCDKIIFAGLSETQKSYFADFPEKKIVSVDSLDEWRELIGRWSIQTAGELRCRPAECASGLLAAKHSKQLLVIDPTAGSLQQGALGKKRGLIVVESLPDVRPLVAANLAHALDFDLIQVDALDERRDSDMFQKLIREWKRDRSEGAHTRLVQDLQRRVKNYDLTAYEFVVFFTEGIPHGLLESQAVRCYVNMSLRSDVFVFNCLYYEKTRPFESTVVFSPETFADEETPVVIDKLTKGNFVVKGLVGQKATVRNLEFFASHYPYDLLHICSHGGETDGYYVVMKFKDRAGLEHVLEYEEVVGFAPEPGSDLVAVFSKSIFRRFDGAPWMSAELKAKGLPSYVFEDMAKAMRAKREDKNVIRVKANYPISASCHIKCVDSLHQGHFRMLASHTSPLIFNNTCWSWYEISTSFINAGCRGYIGTLWGIKNKNATDAAKAFYDDGSSELVARRVDQMNRSLAGTVDSDVYSYWGLPFTVLPRARGEGRAKVLKEMVRGAVGWLEYSREPKEEELQRNAARAAQFLLSELHQTYRDDELASAGLHIRKVVREIAKTEYEKAESPQEHESRGVFTLGGSDD